ncbi:male germ cell-associated kinase [Sarotherodon galilaeus]
MVHSYWVKKLTALHERLAAQMNQLLVDERHPEWLTEGQTVLILKDPKKGPVPSNYRPITCLSTTWKLLSGIIAAKMNGHMELYKINRTLRAFIRNSMGMWRTTLEANFKPIAQVTIKYGIYQGDALSPLLFCIGLNPLSEIIDKTGYGY